MWVDSGWTWRSGCKRTNTHMHAHTQSFSPQTKGQGYRRADENKWSSFVLLPVGLLLIIKLPCVDRRQGRVSRMYVDVD
jgi:hypothetical protein